LASRAIDSLAEGVFVAVALIMGAAALLGLGWACWMALSVRGGERRLREGTAAAYVGTVSLDLKLAHRAMSGGDAAAGETRMSRAQDKLNAPQLAGRPPAPLSGELEDLESRYAAKVRPIRRQRAMDRLGREGAEVRDPGRAAK
jgi:hypothetical protein